MYLMRGIDCSVSDTHAILHKTKKNIYMLNRMENFFLYMNPKKRIQMETIK